VSDRPSDPLDPDLFGPGQARDERFRVVDRWRDMVNHPKGSPEYRREFLHRQMNEEMNVMEQAAQSLVDFPDAPWEIRKAIAGQCADEARHTLAYLRLMKERGIEAGEYPILNFQFRVLQRIDTLVGRLAIENRSFEADGLDAATYGADAALNEGDPELSALLDSQAADEITHVGLGVTWINREMKADPRTLLKIARAMDHLRRAVDAAMGEAGDVVYDVAVDERLLAGFGLDEIERAGQLLDERKRRSRVRQPT
jgi:uncharacterized ferritin-like protein (DUF455 family)